jgi:hypothetical protein
MILLVWNSSKAGECATALEQHLEGPVHVALTVHDACERLRSSQYSAVVSDDWIFEGQAAMADVFFAQLGMAVPVFVNFSISSVQRVAHQVRSALSRRRIETELARHAVAVEWRCELKDDVTAILLSCELGIQEANASDSAKTRLRQIEEVATRMKSRLATVAEKHKTAAASG